MPFPVCRGAGTPGAPLNLAVTMLIVFGSAKLLEELSERFGLPGIVGQILAGILIGPSVFGWISPNESDAESWPSWASCFSCFGVGLEVDAKGLLKTGGVAVMTGVLGVIVPFASGWAFYRLWGRSNIEAVFLGVALTATSVGITAQVLAARDLLHHTAAKIILGAAVVDDILALLLLGFVTSVAQGRVNYQELAITSGLALVFVVLVAWWGTRAVKQVAQRAGMESASGRSGIRRRHDSDVWARGPIRQDRCGRDHRSIPGRNGLISIRAPSRARSRAGVTELLVPFFLAEIGLHFEL